MEPVELDSQKKIFNIKTISLSNSEIQIQKSKEKSKSPKKSQKEIKKIISTS